MKGRGILMGIKKTVKTAWDKIPKTVSISIFVFIFALPIWLIMAFLIRGFLKRSGEGLLIETFGMLLDVLVIGIIILWLNEIRDKKRRKELEIQRYQEEIDDFRGWDEKEATFRIVGNIRRLNKRGVTYINLIECYLMNARLNEANLKRADLRNAKLQEALLGGANLQTAYLRGANLEGASLVFTNLQGADLLNAKLQKAWLMRTNLSGTKNLNVEQLSKVLTLYEAKLDSELEAEIKEKFPHLLEEPKRGG